MKKIFSFLTAVVLTCTVSAQSLFSTQFQTEADFAAWTVVDANGDGSTWKFDNPDAKYGYNSSNAGDDWLISPEIVPTKTGTVAVLYSYKGNSYAESMEVYIGTTTNPADFTTPLATHPEILSEEYHSYVLVDATAGQAFRVAFHATTPKDRFNLYIHSVEAKHIESAMDLGVTEIVSPATGENLGQETVTVKVANHATSDATNISVSYQIDENDPVTETIEGTITAGDTVEYTFATKADLSIPRHLYHIKAFTSESNDLNTSNDACSISVRHKAPATVPYFLGFEADEDVSGIVYHNLNEDTGKWAVDQSGMWMRTGKGCLAYNYSSDNAGDDWAILEPINVEAGYYALKFWYSATQGHPEKLAVYYGNAATPAAQTTKIFEANPVSNSTYNEAIVILNFTEAQAVYFGFYSFSPKNENWLVVDDISFEKVSSESIDLAASRFSAPFDFLRSGNGTDVVVEARNLGINDLTAEVKLTIDAGTATTQNIAVKGQEIKSVTFANALAGLSEGKHTLQVVVAVAGDTNATNDTLSKEIVVLGTPTKFWDFEDGKVPAEFTYEVNDGGTVHPDAGEEFNEYGWGIFKLRSHAQLGTYVLAGTSWIDGVAKADRTIILPAVDIKSEDSYFVWDANSFTAAFLERYSVDIQDNTVSWPYFTEKYFVAAESNVPTTHGISLKDYAGKNISIAFNLTTADGEALILDNIGIYDEASGEVSNTEDLLANAIIISNDEIRANGAQGIILTDVLSRTIKTGAGEVLDLTDIPTGVYIVIVKTANTTTSCKFIKK